MFLTFFRVSKILINENVILLIFLFILPQIVTAEEVYKWTDKSGTVHFSDIPPHYTSLTKNKKINTINVPDIGIDKDKQAKITKDLMSIKLENERWWKDYERTRKKENREKTKKEINLLKEQLRKKKIELEKKLSRLKGWEEYQTRLSSSFKSYYPEKRKKVFSKMEEERKRMIENMTKTQRSSMLETQKLEEEIKVINIGIDYTESITPPAQPSGTIQP